MKIPQHFQTLSHYVEAAFETFRNPSYNKHKLVLDKLIIPPHKKLSEIFVGERNQRTPMERREAWWKSGGKSRANLIIASFQRTSFRIDDCFLEIRCNAWEGLKTEVSFRKFITFDDYLSTNVSHKQCESTARSQNYNLKTRKAVRFDDPFNFAIDSKERDAIVDHAQVNGNLKEIYVGKEIGRERIRRRDSMTRLN